MPDPRCTATVATTVTGTGTKRALLLEDDDDLQSAIRGLLEEQGYEVIAVANGVDGVHAVLKQDFDVIICDLMMPRLPGDMFYTAIERMRPHLCRSFVFITGHRSDAKVSDFIHRIKGNVIPKPFDLEALMSAVSRAEVTALLH